MRKLLAVLLLLPALALGDIVIRRPGTSWSCVQTGVSATTECKALTAATKYYVTAVVLSNGPTAQTLQIVSGTGTNCDTSQAAVTSTLYLGVNGGASLVLPTAIETPAGHALCCKPSGATAFSCTIIGY